jgi:hypothetical protein
LLAAAPLLAGAPPLLAVAAAAVAAAPFERASVSATFHNIVTDVRDTFKMTACRSEHAITKVQPHITAWQQWEENAMASGIVHIAVFNIATGHCHPCKLHGCKGGRCSQVTWSCTLHCYSSSLQSTRPHSCMPWATQHRTHAQPWQHAEQQPAGLCAHYLLGILGQHIQCTWDVLLWQHVQVV